MTTNFNIIYEPPSCLLCNYSDMEYDSETDVISFQCLVDKKKIELPEIIRENCPLKGAHGSLIQ